MSKTNKSPEFQYPFEHEIDITSIKHADITQECVDYLQLERELDIAGDQGIKADESKYTPPWIPMELKEKSEQELQYEKKKTFRGLLGIEPTELSYPTKKKVIMNYFFVCLGMLSEFITYYGVCHFGFSMPMWESLIVAGAVVAFTKLMSWGLKKYIKDWIKTRNAFKRNFQKGVFICLSICILLNGVCFVFPRISKLDDDKKFRQIELLNEEIEEIEEDGEDLEAIESLENEIAELQKELNKEDGIFLKFVKSLGLIFLCTLTICCSAILFSLAEYYHDAYLIKKELNEVNEKIIVERARYEEYPKVAQLLTRLKREQIRSWAKMNYLQKKISSMMAK